MCLLVGGMMACIGVMELATGRIQQKFQGAPPLEGPLATLGAALMLAYGLYIVYRVAIKP